MASTIPTRKSSGPTAGRSPAWTSPWSETTARSCRPGAKAICWCAATRNSSGTGSAPSSRATRIRPTGGSRPERAVLDADGYLAITGRVKNLIIRGGENISVAEVENLLYAHPKVQNVAVVAMPDPRLVERACAFVIPKPGESITLAELVAYLDARQLARHKFPERLEVVSEFPMTPSGKIQKYRLREAIARMLGLDPVR